MTILIINNYYKKSNLHRVNNIVNALKRLGKTEQKIWKYSEIRRKITNGIEAIILSGSFASLRASHKNQPNYNAEIEFVKYVHAPVLGLCFGHELIGKAFGSEITGPELVKGFRKVKIVDPDEIFSSWRKGTEIWLDQNHEDHLTNLPQDFALLATSETCKIEAMKHEIKPIYGVQAHIERAANEKPEGLQVLRNFISGVVEKKTNTTTLRAPNPKAFRKKVEENEEKYGISSCIYNQCIAEFDGIKLSQLNEKHEIRIIRPFLLTWGVMGRVLGFAGVKAIRKKLRDINRKVEPLRSMNLMSADIDEIRDTIVKLFDEIRETKFKSKKGELREVNSTAASKVLHLTCPGLFVPWDRAIRARYKIKNGDGEDYFQFLSEMKNIAKKLKITISGLQRRYGKKTTRIIDQYNWMNTRKNKG